MTATISFTPQVVSNAAGLFNTQSQGFTQGDVMDDPAVKFQLCSGVLSASATVPLWGGQPIQELIPTAPGQPGQDTLGSTIIQSTTIATISGFSCYNQGYNGITTPQSTAPLYASGQTSSYYRLGSNARIVLPILASLVSLDGDQTNVAVTWDFTNNQISTYSSGTALPVRILKVSASGNLCVNYASGQANWGSTTASTSGAMALCLI